MRRTIVFMTHTPVSSRPVELDQAAALLHQCKAALEGASRHMPVMAVDWFGPASNLWRTRSDQLRTEIDEAVDAARIAAEQIQVVP